MEQEIDIEKMKMDMKEIKSFAFEILKEKNPEAYNKLVRGTGDKIV